MSRIGIFNSGNNGAHMAVSHLQAGQIATTITSGMMSGNISRRHKTKNHINIKQNIFLIILMMSVLFFAFVVIYVKNTERQLFNQIQMAKEQRDHLQVEWGQLLLEASTWSRPTRVQQIARHNFNMHLPQSENVVLIEL